MTPDPASGNTPAGLPDADDPNAVADWIDGIERESARISVRQSLVLDLAEASHEVFLLKTKPLPLWASPADRRRAWTLVGIGLALALLGTVGLLTVKPGQTAALVPFPIACLVWFVVVAHEAARTHRTRTTARLDRDSRLLAATQRRDTAQARLDAHTTPPPSSP